MNKKLILFGIFFLILSFSMYIVKADINLTIQSENERIIKITDLSSYSEISNTTNNNKVSLPYNNYILNIYTSSKKIDNQTFLNNIKVISSDKNNLFWLAVILSIIGLMFLIIKQYFKD